MIALSLSYPYVTNSGPRIVIEFIERFKTMLLNKDLPKKNIDLRHDIQCNG